MNFGDPPASTTSGEVGPHDRYGSRAALQAATGRGGFTPTSGHAGRQPPLPRRATSGITHRSKQHVLASVAPFGAAASKRRARRWSALRPEFGDYGLPIMTETMPPTGACNLRSW